MRLEFSRSFSEIQDFSDGQIWLQDAGTAMLKLSKTVAAKASSYPDPFPVSAWGQPCHLMAPRPLAPPIALPGQFSPVCLVSCFSEHLN